MSGLPYREPAWLTAERTYEGFPLLLRRPGEIGDDLPRALYSALAVVTHEFAKRLANGLPEGAYNRGLFEMDCDLVTVFDSERMGIPVLVETFGGERNYYFYVSPDADAVAILSAFVHRYPMERLSWEIRPDPQWKFIDEYAREYF